ncbi:MAG: hypothetical protein ABI592_04205 [Acidobacteriota bacterium]
MHRLSSRFAAAFGSAALAALACLPARAALASPPDPPTYRCQGFDEPMNRPTVEIGRGRVLPLRAKLVAADGKFADDGVVKAAPTIHVVYAPEGGKEVDKSGGLEVRDYGKGNHFVFDQEAHWKFDLGTGNLPEDGTYKVTVLSGDAKEYRVDPTCSLEFHLHAGK